MADFVEVVDAGKGWTQVRDAEGNVYKLEGARNWRNNNPGNIEYGPFARSLGAVGSDGRFAVFPSYEAGRQAKEQLIFSSPSYRDLTLEQAISRYAPPNENNTRSYINQVAAAAGVPASTPMSQIPQSVRGNVLNAMERVEGFKPGRTYNAQGIPLPPAEIPNVVATLQDTTPPPRVAPSPATISPDLSLMRNPQVSPEARAAQVTPLPPPLPQRRPSAPDIVTPSMAAVNAQRGNVNATRAVDMLASTQNPVTPRLTADGRNIYSYHIPDMTPTTVTGGLGSLTPSPARVRLPELPPSNIGQPPTTRSVQSVPFNSSSMPQPTAAQINDAARRASLTATQGYVERALPSVPTAMQATARTAPMGSSAQNIAAQRAEQLSQRPTGPYRLAPGPIGLTPNTNGVRLNQPPIQVVPSPFATPRSIAPVPMAAGMRPLAPARVAPRPLPRMAAPAAPLRVVVNGANSYSGGNAPQPQRMQIAGYTNDGNGRLTNQETGGVYYERHLR